MGSQLSPSSKAGRSWGWSLALAPAAPTSAGGVMHVYRDPGGDAVDHRDALDQRRRRPRCVTDLVTARLAYRGVQKVTLAPSKKTET